MRPNGIGTLFLLGRRGSRAYATAGEPAGRRNATLGGAGDLDGRLRRRGVDALVVTGGETDVCVLGTVLGAVDRGYRVVVVEDALCSASDEAHEALLLVYRSRYDCQVETASTAEVLEAWPP